jgi:hypothetical protein
VNKKRSSSFPESKCSPAVEARCPPA